MLTSIPLDSHPQAFNPYRPLILESFRRSGFSTRYPDNLFERSTLNHLHGEEAELWVDFFSPKKQELICYIRFSEDAKDFLRGLSTTLTFPVGAVKDILSPIFSNYPNTKLHDWTKSECNPTFYICQTCNCVSNAQKQLYYRNNTPYNNIPPLCSQSLFTLYNYPTI